MTFIISIHVEANFCNADFDVLPMNISRTLFLFMNEGIGDLKNNMGSCSRSYSMQILTPWIMANIVIVNVS